MEPVKQPGERSKLLRNVGRLASCGLLFCAATSALADDKLTAVADLRYGVALFHYYQNENLEALSELMVAQARGGIRGHGDNPEIMEGGFRMAYGMERKAGEIFGRLLDENRSERVRNAAWFHLAKLRYVNRDWVSTQVALDRIEGDLDSEIEYEKTTLQLNLHLQQEQIKEAEELLDARALRYDRSGYPYLHYNIGAAHSRAGDYDKATKYYKKLLTMRAYQPEYFALYDKAMTAAGYSQLLNNNLPGAVEMFAKVRMDSNQSNRALLGYGWAASQLGDYTLALKPWTVLSQRPLIDQNTLEVMLAIPFAHEQLGYSGLALKELRNAEEAYLAEMARLETVIKTVKAHSVEHALSVERSKDINWLDYAQEHRLTPQLTYLVDMFSREVFIDQASDLRDMLAIKTQFLDWQNKLAFYRDMLDEREQNRVGQLKYVKEEGLAEKIAAMLEQRDQLAQKVQALKQENDFLGLLDPENSAKIERILNAEKNAELLTRASQQAGLRVMPDEELTELKETLRKQKGFMVWRSQEMYEERLWRVEHELNQLDRALGSIRRLEGSVNTIVDESVGLQTFRDRISYNEQRLSQQLDVLNQAIDASEESIRTQVISVLEGQKQRLKHYLAQSRLSIARVLDYARTEARINSDTDAQTESVENNEADATVSEPDEAMPVREGQQQRAQEVVNPLEASE